MRILVMSDDKPSSSDLEEQRDKLDQAIEDTKAEEAAREKAEQSRRDAGVGESQ